MAKVVELFKGLGLQDVKAGEVHQFLIDNLDYRYRFLRPSSLESNSERCLVLRQQFSLRLLQWLKSKPRLINIDESWLGMSDFRRAAWVPKDQPCTETKAPISPRVSLIVALDSHGEIYWALNQTNTDKEVMCLFLRGLVTRLNQESRHWRKNTVIFFDGAPYHDAKETLAEAQALDIPLAIMGPYSYDTAPCELLFAAFKDRDINPARLPTGKK